MLRGPLAALRHRQFRIVWLAMFVSDLGTWMQIGALGIYMVEGTGRATWVGIITTVSYLATGLVAPLGGTLADRYDRRLVVAAGTIGQLLLAGALAGAFAAGVRSPLLLTVIVGLQGALGALVIPTLSAMIPDLVPAEDLMAANSFFHVSWNVGRAAGPAVAVAIIALASYELVFAINGATFAAVALAMLAVSAHPRHISTGSTWRRIAAGASTLVRHRPSRHAVSLYLAEMVLVAPFIALIPVMSQLTLGGSAADTGWLYAAQGIGSALGVLVIAALVPRLGQERTVLFSLSAMVVCGTAYALSPTLLVAMLLILPLSGLHSSVLAGSTSLLQRDTPPEMRGRVLAMASSVTNLGYAAAGVAFAAAADVAGLRPVLVTGCALLAVAILLLSRQAAAAAGAQPQPA